MADSPKTTANSPARDAGKGVTKSQFEPDSIAKIANRTARILNPSIARSMANGPETRTTRSMVTTKRTKLSIVDSYQEENTTHQ